MKKRILALFLCLTLLVTGLQPTPLTASAAGETYDMSFVPGHVRLKMNVYDYDAAKLTGAKVPLSGITIGVNRHTSYNMTYYGAQRPINNIFTLTSGADGVAYLDTTFSVRDVSGRKLVYLGGNIDSEHLIYDSVDNSGIACFFDLGPTTPGTSIVTTMEADYLIRNCIGGANGGAIPKTVGGTGAHYDDFFFHNGIVKPYTAGQDGHAANDGGGASIEFDVYVKTNNVTVSFANRNVLNWDPADYPAQTVAYGGYVTEPANFPVNAVNSEIEFLGWADSATGQLFDFSQPVTASVVLVPKWGPNSNVKGYIHLNSYLWIHDNYNGTYGSGQTSTTVNDLKYELVYYNSDDISVRFQLKTVEVGPDGTLDFEITAAELQTLSDFWDAIGHNHYVTLDIGPDDEDSGWHVAGTDNNYAWDWIKFNTGTGWGAGVTGVRTMLVNTDGNYNLDREDGSFVMGKLGGNETILIGNVMYSPNENHTPWFTESMFTDGFEITWNCYVAPSTVVHFDLNGGVGSPNGNYADQTFQPINSLSQFQPEFLVQSPDGTGHPTKTGMTFAGWYKVLPDGTTESTPWDFNNRIATESMTLRAVYTDMVYTVRFVNPANTAQNQEHVYFAGNTPAWNGADPTKASTNFYSYIFSGWKETTGTHLNNIYTLNGEYDFEHQSRTISGGGFDPVTVDSSFAATTVYTAQFTEVPISYTLSYDLNGGSGSFPDQTYDVNGVTLHTGTPTKEGYSFAGWALKSTTGSWPNRTYSAGETVTSVYGDTELIAVWDSLYKYKLNFDKNCTDSVTGLPGTVETADWTPDASVTLQWTTEPSRANYDFLGWALSSGGTVAVPAGTKAYQLTGTAGSVKEVTLYAVWQIESRTYTVNYLEYGTNTVLQTPFTAQAPIGSTVTKTAPSITGYTVHGDASASLTITSGTGASDNVINFYYDKASYPAVAAGDAGITMLTGTGNYLYQATVTFTAAVLNGYTFDGWYDGTTKVSSDLTYVFTMPAHAVTYTAKTTEQTVEYQYIAVCRDSVSTGEAFGSVTPTSQSVGKVNGLPGSGASAVTPAFRFVGWYTTASPAEGAVPYCTGTTIAPTERDADGFLIGGTFYAVFERNEVQYKVEHYLESSAGEYYLGDYAFKTGISGQMTAETPGTFAGHSPVLPVEQKQILSDGSTVVKIYYNRNLHTLSYIVENDDPDADYSEDLYVGDEIHIYSPQQAGYSFDGWYTDTAYQERWEPTVTMGDADLTLYGRFVQAKASLTVVKNGMQASENAIFLITGPGLGSGLRVAVHGNGGSVTVAGLSVGAEYTVTEETGYSWKYSSDIVSGTCTITQNGLNQVVFTNTARDDRPWLGAETRCRNVFGKAVGTK